MKTFRMTWLALGALGASILAGCDQAPEAPAPVPEAPAPAEAPAPVASTQKSALVAEIALAGKRRLGIYETGNGGFQYVQSGPYGTEPVKLPSAESETRDPEAIFRQLAPGQLVPDALTAANKRAVAYLHDHQADDGALAPDTGKAGASEVAQVHQALGSRDWKGTGSTGQPGCPDWWFDQQSVPGFNDINWFCPSIGNAACYHYVNWAYLYSSSASNSYGVVCSDSGTATFQSVVGTTTDTWLVPQGTWTMVEYYPAVSCGWFTCSKVRTFQKFNLQNGPAVAQFGAKLR
jgi:hypothetical protein